VGNVKGYEHFLKVLYADRFTQVFMHKPNEQCKCTHTHTLRAAVWVHTHILGCNDATWQQSKKTIPLQHEFSGGDLLTRQALTVCGVVVSVRMCVCVCERQYVCALQRCH
jgi:hypothetical protein